MQNVTIQMHNRAEDFFRILWRVRRWTLLSAFLGICLILGAFSFYAMMAKPVPGTVDKRWIIYVTSLFVPGFVALVMYFSLKLAARKAALSAEPVSMTFDEYGVAIDGPKANARSEWNAYKNILETSDDFVFYVQKNIFYGVPKRFFEDATQVEKVRAFIAERFRH